MTTRISQLDNISTVQGNVLVPLVSNITGNLTTVKGSVDTLKAFIVAATEANIVTANIAMKGYVDSVTTAWTANAGQQLSDLGNLYANASSQQSTLNSLLANAGSQSDLIIGINANVAAANIGMVGYVDNKVSTANLGMKGYVDSVASQSIYGNSNVTAYTVTMGFTNFSNVNVSALITTNGLTNYSNVNTKAYAESMGYQNYGNVNVSALITTNGLTNYSNINLAAYLGGAVNIGGSLTTLNAGNISAGGYFLGNGSQLSGLPSGYSNVQVAIYLPTYSGNIANLTLGPSGVLTFRDGTTMITAASGSGGGSNYSNVNVTAYTETMGFTNFSNVNVSALITTNGLTNYSNVNLIAYLAGNVSSDRINANTVTATYNITANTIHALANIKIGGSGLDWTEPALQINGYVNINGNIDVYGRAQLGNIKLKYGTLLSDTSNGEFLVGGNITTSNISASYFVGQHVGNASLTNLSATGIIYANSGTQSTSVGTGALVVTGGAGISGNLTVGNLIVLGTQTTVNAQSVNLSNSFVFLSNNNITNAVDIGFVGQYNAGAGNVYTGLTYRAADGVYRLFSNVGTQPSLTVNFTNAVYSSLQVGGLNAIGNVLSTGLSVFGNTAHGLTGAVSGQWHTFVGNLTQTSSGGSVYFTTTGNLMVGGNIIIGSVGVVSGAFHTVVGNITQTSSGGAVYINTTGNVSAANINAGQINTTGNVLATGLSAFGNTTHGVAGAVSGQFHSFVGNITQTSSGGAVYFNTAGNLMVGGNILLAGNLTVGTVGAVSGAFHTVVGNITQVTSGGAVGINTTGNISASVANFNAGNVGGFAIGYRDVPQITAANVTLIASDAGKHYYGSNTNPVTLTIPLNSSVAFGNGTAISVVNQGTGNITITPAGGVLLYLAGNTTAGSKTLTSYGMATLLKVQVNTWFINGTGLV